MIKLFSLILILAIVTLTACGSFGGAASRIPAQEASPSASGSGSADERFSYVKKGAMIIGYGVRTMNYTDNGVFTGFDTELARQYVRNWA